ncbi:NADPH-dependent F420 reductase [Celerinatantimonas sp. YJH-8]|uniref:NADPH-dependent F420 reductase n=1 Tax=Celerinatantimonas sp. YJH-8 TaxID=3228714 RepID=UPI0038C5B44F
MKHLFKWLAGVSLLLTWLITQNAVAAQNDHDIAAQVASGKIQLAVIGAGSLGSSVGSAWVRAGYKVMFSTRHPDELHALTQKLGPNALIGTPEQAASFGQIVLLAVPYKAIPQVSHDYATQLKGKIMLDATNSWWSGRYAIVKEALKDGDGVVNQRYFKGVRLVRAFSAVDATVIAASSEGKRPPAGVPLASNDPQAMQIAAELVKAAGCVPVIVGDLQAGRSFEHKHKGFRANTTPEKLRKILKLPANH